MGRVTQATHSSVADDSIDEGLQPPAGRLASGISFEATLGGARAREVHGLGVPGKHLWKGGRKIERYPKAWMALEGSVQKGSLECQVGYL